MKQFHLSKMNRLKRRQEQTRVPVWSRVRTTCIAILLVCNVVLLAVLGCVKGYDAYLSHRTRTHMDAMLAERGILCGSSVYHVLDDCPEVYTMHADSAVQEALARALLTGTVTSGAEKGNTMVWTGENGSVSWASSGELDAQVGLYSEPEPASAEQAQKLLRRVLAKAGIDVPEKWMESTPLGEGSGNNGYSITIRQELEGTQLLGCGLTAVLEPGNELTLTGIWCTGDPQRMNVRALETYSAEQALFQLLGSDISFAQIISAQPVYVLSDKSGGRFTTVPCWRFSTENGDYVLNILTGDVVASADIDAGSTDTTEPVNWDDIDYDDGIIDDGQQSTDTGATGTDSLPETTETVGTGADADSDLDISWDERE